MIRQLINIIICFSILNILVGCAEFITKQYVPIPETEIDPDNAVIIINRPHALLAFGNSATVLDNDKPIGEIGNGGELKWSRPEGTVKLDIAHINRKTSSVVGYAIYVTFDVKKKNIYKFSYKSGGTLQPSSLKLEGEESSKIYFTSIPPGAAVYAGINSRNLLLTQIITPHTIEYNPQATMWAPECYKMKLKGYDDSPVVCKSNSFGNRIIHYNFENPTTSEPPLSELPTRPHDDTRRNNTPIILIPPAIPE